MLSTEEVLAIIKKGEPVSLTRYGDGEAIILNGFNDVPALKSVFKRQFGFTPEIEQAEEIRENLISAYQNCDVIGVPLKRMIEREPESYWGRSPKIMLDNTGIDLDNTDIPLCSIDVHSKFLDNGYFTEFLTNIETLNYISCRNLDDRFREKFNIKRVNSFIISPEAKFSTNTTGEKHYPTQFNKIKKWMDKAINCEGAICLVGAGVVGKIYCNWFRDRGGIAIDIGSSFDALSGKVTRGPDRGFDKEDNEHKL